MRTVCCILFTFFLGISWSQVNDDTLRISGHQKYKKIPTCIGVICIESDCTTAVPTGSTALYLMHDNVAIGKIKQTSMICELPNGICSKMTFILDGAESVSQAGKQAAKQFGKPQYTKQGSKYVYTWLYETKMGISLQIKLEVASDLQSGVMTIEERE